MKIYKELVIDIESGDVLSEDSFEYAGPIAHCGSGGDDAYVGPSWTELALQKSQKKILDQALSESDLMTPELFAQAGLKKDNTGNWVSMTYDEQVAAMNPNEKASLEADMLSKGMDINGNKLTEEQMLAKMTPEQAQEYKANSLSNQRYIDALEGKVPISPGMEEELKTEQGRLEEVLRRKLGAGYLTSTSGQSAMAKLMQKNNLVREEARRGEIASGASRFYNTANLGLAKSADATNKLVTQTNLKQQKISNMANIPGRNLGLMSGAGGLVGQLQGQQAAMNTNIAQKNANNAASTQGYVQLGTTATTTAASVAAAAAAA